jgi:hypothetical protein
MAVLEASGGQSRPASLIGGYYDYTGLIHLHTNYSGDARGSYRQIARAANQQNIDFLIATDHNNLNAIKDKREGWYGSTLFLTGVESSRPEGYLLGLDIRNYAVKRGDPTENFLKDTARQGGIALIAHPCHRKWGWRGPLDPRMAGMEIINLTDLFHASTISEKIISLLYYPLNSAAAYLELYERPFGALQMWDEITQGRRFVGIYAPDFHQSVYIGDHVRLHAPSASQVMRFARDHIVSHVAFSGWLETDKEIVYDALRAGHLYVSLDILSNGTGFLFSAKQGSETAWMGDELQGQGETRFTVTVPPASNLRNPMVHAYRNGEEIARGSAPQSTFVFSGSRPGVYRVEVTVEIPTFRGGRREVTWIYSNPIYVRARQAPPKVASEQRFLPVRIAVHNVFNLYRHLISRATCDSSE